MLERTRFPTYDFSSPSSQVLNRRRRWELPRAEVGCAPFSRRSLEQLFSFTTQTQVLYKMVNQHLLPWKSILAGKFHQIAGPSTSSPTATGRRHIHLYIASHSFSPSSLSALSASVTIPLLTFLHGKDATYIDTRVFLFQKRNMISYVWL